MLRATHMAVPGKCAKSADFNFIKYAGANVDKRVAAYSVGHYCAAWSNMDRVLDLSSWLDVGGLGDRGGRTQVSALARSSSR